MSYLCAEEGVITEAEHERLDDVLRFTANHAKGCPCNECFLLWYHNTRVDQLTGQIYGSIPKRQANQIENRALRLEAAISRLVSWRQPVELIAPQLGGLLAAMDEAAALVPGLTPTSPPAEEE